MYSRKRHVKSLCVVLGESVGIITSMKTESDFRQPLKAPSWLKLLQFPNVSFGQEWHCYTFTSTTTPERNHIFLANSPVTHRMLLLTFLALEQFKQHILSVSHWFQEISVVKQYSPWRPLTTGPGVPNVIYWGRLKYLGQNWHRPNMLPKYYDEMNCWKTCCGCFFFASGSPPLRSI